MTVQDLLSKLPATAFRSGSPNFEPKLNFDERCAVLALHRQNVSIVMLAAAFGINRRTVNRIVADGSTRYREVRDQEKRMGTEEFCQHYITEEITQRVAAAADKPETKQSSDQYDQTPKAERSGIPSQRANSLAGINMWQVPGAEYAHRIEVKWLEANTAEDDNGPFEHPAGWFSRDLDGPNPERWDGDIENNSHVTSAKAFAYAKTLGA